METQCKNIKNQLEVVTDQLVQIQERVRILEETTQQLKQDHSADSSSTLQFLGEINARLTTIEATDNAWYEMPEEHNTYTDAGEVQPAGNDLGQDLSGVMTEPGLQMPDYEGGRRLAEPEGLGAMPTRTQNLRAVDPRSSPTPQLLSASSRYDSGSMRQPPTFDTRGAVSQGSADVTQLTTAFVQGSMQRPDVQLADYLIPKGMGPIQRTEQGRESSYAVAPYRDPHSSRYTPDSIGSHPLQSGTPYPATSPTSC